MLTCGNCGRTEWAPDNQVGVKIAEVKRTRNGVVASVRCVDCAREEAKRVKQKRG